MSASADIVSLTAPVADGALAELADALVDCVAGGASVSFMAPFSLGQALGFFSKVAGSVAAGDTVLLAAKLDGRIVGTVQLGLDTPPNQPHRADVTKLLVRRSARKRGIGQRLMARAEAEARKQGWTLLVLDTVTGDPAERLYERMDWTKVGVIPNFALYPDGRPCDTTVFWKALD